MDDFHACGPRKASQKFLDKFRTVLDMKASDVVETGRYSHLKRDRLRKEKETLVRASVKHVDDFIELLNLQK